MRRDRRVRGGGDGRGECEVDGRHLERHVEGDLAARVGGAVVVRERRVVEDELSEERGEGVGRSAAVRWVWGRDRFSKLGGSLSAAVH